VRLVTPTKHANVDPHGRICLSILDRNYTVETTLHNVLASVFGLLFQPETSGPEDTTLAQLFYKADGPYEATIPARVRAHASSKSLAQWKADLSGGSGRVGGAGGGRQQMEQQDPGDESVLSWAPPRSVGPVPVLKGRDPAGAAVEELMSGRAKSVRCHDSLLVRKLTSLHNFVSREERHDSEK